MTDERPRLDELLPVTHRMLPDDLPDLAARHAARLGAEEVVVYLADLDQRLLVPLPSSTPTAVGRIAIDGTIAGRCFRTMTVVDSKTAEGARVLWLPIVDGTERVGVLALSFADDPPAAADHGVRELRGRARHGEERLR